MSGVIAVWQVQVSEDDQWCDDCNTSAAYKVDAYLVYETLGTPTGVRHQGTGSRCTTCQPFTEEDEG